MPINVKALHAGRATVSIDVTLMDDDGNVTKEPIVVTYRPMKYTPDVERKLNEARETDGWRGSWGVNWLLNLIESWDIELEPGVTLPVTLDTIAQLPDIVLGELMVGLSNDMGKARQSSDATSA